MEEQPNINGINELAAGDESIKNRLVSVLKEEFPEEVSNYETFIKEKKWDLAAECVHKIRHKIAILGFEEGYYLSVKYEKELLQNSQLFQKDFEIILKKITKFIKTL